MLTPPDLFTDWQRSLTPADRTRWHQTYHHRSVVFSGVRQAVAAQKVDLLIQLRHELGETNQ